MKKILFVYPKIEFEENYPNSWIPFSVLTLATSLNIKKIEAKIFDQNKHDILEYKDYLDKYKDDLLCVAFSIMTGGAQIKNALEMAKLAKEYNITTVFGGPHVNVLPEQTARHELVDYALKGMGQFQFPMFADALMGKGNFEDVCGIYYYKGNELVIGKENVPKGIFLPAYDFNYINTNDYIQNDNTINTKTINYIASQGCPYTCKFCYETCYKRKYFQITEESIMQDIDYFVKNYNVNGIKFYDADWFVNYKRSINLSRRMKPYNLKWAASINPRDILRAQKGDTNELLEEISNSGCTRLLMGMESGNNRVLKDIVDKRVTKEELKYVAELISKYRILGSYTFIVGFPNETKDEINDTLNFVKELWNLEYRPETRVHIYTPYPGTQLYDDAIKLGFQEPKNLEEWSKFDYYRSMTPWTDESLEKDVRECTSMIEKKLIMKK